jgi:hypothetical protein
LRFRLLDAWRPDEMDPGVTVVSGKAGPALQKRSMNLLDSISASLGDD